jgi:predicted Zn-dependent peptidase
VYKVTRLENGLRVASAEMPHMTSVCVGFWVGTGSRYEPPKLNGICHFIEHLLFKGTRKRNAKEISQAVEGVGGSLNAFTSEEITCFHARASSDRFENLLDVLADMFLNSLFIPAEIHKERAVIKEEISMYLDEPQHQVQELLNSTMWPGQPLGRPITGTPASLDGISRGDIQNYLRANYIAANTVIAAAGRIEHQTLVRAAKKYARRFPAGLSRIMPAATQRQDRERISLFTKDTEQTQMALGFRAFSRHDERRYALRLLNALLGENMSSRLFQIIREDNGLAYSIYSSPSFFQDAGDFVISAGLDTNKLTKTLRLVFRELRRIAGRAPSTIELRRARDYVAGQMDLSQESTESQMNWVGEQLLGYGKTSTPGQIQDKLKRVIPAEIRETAKALFRSERLNLALVSPLKKTAGLAKIIRSESRFN